MFNVFYVIEETYWSGQILTSINRKYFLTLQQAIKYYRKTFANGKEEELKNISNISALATINSHHNVLYCKYDEIDLTDLSDYQDIRTVRIVLKKENFSHF